jgi:hypothetical protein
LVLELNEAGDAALLGGVEQLEGIFLAELDVPGRVGLAGKMFASVLADGEAFGGGKRRSHPARIQERFITL